MSTGKTLLPSIFFIEFFLGRQTLLYRPHSIPSFRSRDSGPPPVRFSLGSDPFSHPSGSSARFGGSSFFLKSRLSFSPLLDTRRPTRCSESRKRSVPSRVHSVFKNSGSWAARAGPVQHLVDSRRGRIASKLISTAIFVAGAGERAHPISPGGLAATHFALACPRSP